MGELKKPLIAFLVSALTLSVAFARNDNGQYDNAPFHDWFESQHNSLGQWCCNEADGHPYNGDYKFNADGSVTAYDGQAYTIAKEKILTGKNPTGHAIWWFVDSSAGRYTYCFAPGQMG